MASVLPPESVFVWRLDGLVAGSFAVGSDVEWPSPSFLACGLQWHVRLVPNVQSSDGVSHLGAYLYLETPDSTCWPAVAEITVSSSLNQASTQLSEPFSTKRPSPKGASRNWGKDRLVNPMSLFYFHGTGCSLVVRVRLRARAFNELEVPTIRRSVGTLAEDLVALLGDEAHADVRFRCIGGEIVGGHSILSAARSSTLRALLYGPLAAKLPAELHVPDCISAAIMSRLVHFLYTDEASFSSAEEAQHLLYAADYYGVPRLMTLCERELHVSLTMANVLDALALAHTCNCSELRSTALRFVAQHAAEVMSGQAWASLRDVHPELEGAVMHTVAHGEPPPRVVAREPRTPPRRLSSASPGCTAQGPGSSSS